MWGKNMQTLDILGPSRFMKAWYFVTKIVLTYCERKLFFWLRKTFKIQCMVSSTWFILLFTYKWCFHCKSAVDIANIHGSRGAYIRNCTHPWSLRGWRENREAAREKAKSNIRPLLSVRVDGGRCLVGNWKLNKDPVNCNCNGRLLVLTITH